MGGGKAMEEEEKASEERKYIFFILKFGGMMPFFLFILYILAHAFSPSIRFIQYIHPSPFAEVPLHLLIAGQLSGKNLPAWGAEPRIELGSALQQADALTSELRRTLLSYAEP
jgi:hypothetical protein